MMRGHMDDKEFREKMLRELMSWEVLKPIVKDESLGDKECFYDGNEIRLGKLSYDGFAGIREAYKEGGMIHGDFRNDDERMRLAKHGEQMQSKSRHVEICLGDLLGEHEFIAIGNQIIMGKEAFEHFRRELKGSTFHEQN